jgi:LAS superfamily LD-carboxypeptidase LdcB
MKPHELNWKKWAAIASVAIVAAGLLGYGVRLATQLVIMNGMLKNELVAEEKAAQFRQMYFENQLGMAVQDNTNLQQNLEAQKSRNDAIESQVSQISGTVGTLQKLSDTDPQLLQKYSRIYFLNENYVPKSLTNVDSAYLFAKDKPEQYLSQALPFLVNLLIAANQAGVKLQVASAYRSFGQQSQLKSIYTVTYGSGANRFSADQGYSEHQLGTAVDFITPDFSALSLKFASSSAYEWVVANAYKYGFELSYPKNNPYYIYEPWHWRFVGIALATWLHQQNITFYDAPQRTINQYLISLFDQ